MTLSTRYNTHRETHASSTWTKWYVQREGGRKRLI